LASTTRQFNPEEKTTRVIDSRYPESWRGGFGCW